jgi:nucleotidyltransferase/DNA polymerase involved in DNA repair
VAGSQRWILHVDLDQFIAAVEVLRRPELRGLPVVVGGDGDPGKRGAYEAVSSEVMAVLRELAPAVEVMGWDEAFLAVETDDPESFARRVQDRVAAATRLRCSVGIGENRLQAKLATGFGKVSLCGQHTEAEESRFIQPDWASPATFRFSGGHSSLS